MRLPFEDLGLLPKVMRLDLSPSRQCLGHVLDLFHRRLGQGEEEMAADSGPVETRH
jgi:hypothetical protein